MRAAIVDRPSAYPWSSYSAYADLGSPGPLWLTRNFVLSLFGETSVGARAALRAFTELEVGDGVEDRAQPVTPDSDPELGSYEVLAANVQHPCQRRVHMPEVRFPFPVAVLGLALLCLMIGAWLGSVTAQQETLRVVQPEGAWLLQPLARVRANDREAGWLSNAATGDLFYLQREKATRVNLPKKTSLGRPSGAPEKTITIGLTSVPL